YTTNDNGNVCPVQVATGNTPPVVEAGPNYTIPAQTPFELSGSATDVPTNTLTYDWEEFDLGAPAPPNTDNGNRPIFRSFPPTSSPKRILPKLSDILSNTTTLGESLPTTDRNMLFRLTARDNRANGGGIASDTMTVTVVSAAGPFLITAPNTAVT